MAAGGNNCQFRQMQNLRNHLEQGPVVTPELKRRLALGWTQIETGYFVGDLFETCHHIAAAKREHSVQMHGGTALWQLTGNHTLCYAFGKQRRGQKADALW